MNKGKIQLKLDPAGVKSFSICIRRLQPTFIFLYFNPLLSRFPLLKHPHSEKLKTCDREEKCLKYINRNLRSERWAIMQIEKPVKLIKPPGSSFSLNLHY